MVNAELAKRSVWIMKNQDADSDHKTCKNTAVETKKRLEQLSKQLKVSKPLLLMTTVKDGISVDLLFIHVYVYRTNYRK